MSYLNSLCSVLFTFAIFACATEACSLTDGVDDTAGVCLNEMKSYFKWKLVAYFSKDLDGWTVPEKLPTWHRKR